MRKGSETEIIEKTVKHILPSIFFFIVTPCMLSSYSILTPTTAHI